MTVSVGGLGLVSFRNPFSELVGMVLGKTDFRTLFCLVVIFIVLFVLAYLTNPSENSFRAYLTEQSFRLHLSQLDDNVDDDQPAHKSTSATSSAISYDNASAFHFANKASVALKTPKHISHSFGIFTIAAMIPLAKNAAYCRENQSMIISDSWYIGAFGRWWRGGIIEAWYHDVIARAKDEESWSSGILSMKNLDRHNEYNGEEVLYSSYWLFNSNIQGLPFSTKNLLPHVKASPPRLRNREKSSQRPSIGQGRSSSPPPLPKSALLPLHATRPPASTSDRHSTLTSQPIMPVHTLNSSLSSRSPSALFEQSPRVAEVLRQISQSRAAVVDLRAQLHDCQSCATQTHGVLRTELDSFRERKRQEDACKLESKARTKSLDDSRRATESMKRDAERKLKVAQTHRDSANQRMEYLDREVATLQHSLLEGEGTMHHETSVNAEKEIKEALQRKRREIKVAEDVIIALNHRARDLEEQLGDYKRKLTSIKERNQIRYLASQTPVNDENFWTSSMLPAQDPLLDQSSNHHHTSSVAFNGQRPSLTIDTPSQPISVPTTRSSFNSPTNAYPSFEDAPFSMGHQSIPFRHHPTFSPFNDSEALQNGLSDVVSPTSQSLIPSGLITSLESAGLPWSFQSESDVILERAEQRNTSYTQHSQFRYGDRRESGPGTLVSSPVSLNGSNNSTDRDPFAQVNDIDDGKNESTYLDESAMDLERASWFPRSRSDSHPDGRHVPTDIYKEPPVPEKVSPRWWFSSKEKSKKGLNPDAKVFSLTKKQSIAPHGSFDKISSPNHSFDALNPTGFTSTIPGPSPSTFTRAFAPSPAEREALQRALGGSTNASFERLPSLSDVGSIPSSPSHVHALPAIIPQHAFAKILPAWLQSLPPRKATNFSPWADEEPEVSSCSSVERSG
ncbi:hypothetical protein H0H93_008614 [Arthromyces matolae]|nr:hypothetical protein H0H93_008614 [Arthromyces matolae]